MPHPESRKYAWRRQNPFQQARLDFFLISSELQNLIEMADISPGYRTDHSLVVISLAHAVIECGRGAWEFNNSLLQDTEYLYKIRQCIENVKHLYAATPYSPDSISDIHASELDLIIDDQLFFEMLLLEIRGQSISYSVNCKKNRLDNERVLIEKVKELECELLKSQNEANNANKITNILSALKECNQELENLRNQQLNGTFIRSKARWIEGEKPTKYFLNLEKRNFVNKQMVKMERSDGTLVFRQDEIMGEVFSFYEGLYSKQENVVDGLNSDLLNSLTCKQLTTVNQKKLVEV